MSSPVMSVAGLVDLVGNGGVTVLDVRYRMGGPPGRQLHALGHVPGAAYVDLDTDLAAATGPGGVGGRHPLPAARDFEAAMRRAGVSESRSVAVYDDWGGRAAARAWWLLRFHGHPDVRVLDGGWPAWLAAAQPVETGAVDPEPGDFAAVSGAMPMLDARGALAVGVLLDARAPERYRGEVEPVDPVAGHIPGAVNVPTEDNLDARGWFRTPEELRGRYAEVGAVAGAEVAAYCGSGVTACHDVLAMAVAGLDAALYPGSWSDWVSDPLRPVALGPRP